VFVADSYPMTFQHEVPGLVIFVASSCNDGSNGDNDGSGGSSHY